MRLWYYFLVSFIVVTVVRATSSVKSVSGDGLPPSVVPCRITNVAPPPYHSNCTQYMIFLYCALLVPVNVTFRLPNGTLCNNVPSYTDCAIVNNPNACFRSVEAFATRTSHCTLPRPLQCSVVSVQSGNSPLTHVVFVVFIVVSAVLFVVMLFYCLVYFHCPPHTVSQQSYISWGYGGGV